MALVQDLDIDDTIIVPADSGATIRFAEKSGRKVKVVIESALPVQIVRAKSNPPMQAPLAKRPVPAVALPAQRPEPVTAQ